MRIFAAACGVAFTLTGSLSAADGGREAATRPPAPAPTASDLAGTWAGTLAHAGDTTPIALHLDPQDDGKIEIRMSAPVIHVAEASLGAAAATIDGNEVRLGPFSFTWDGEARTLSGALPEALVPVHRIPLVLRRVERFTSPARPEPSAPVARPIWTFEAGAPLWPGATFAGGVVYAGGDDGVLHAVDASTGRERWAFRAGGAIRARATVAGGAVLFAADDGTLYSLAAEDGKERWRARICDTLPIVRLPFSDPQSRFDRYASDVTAARGRLYVGTHDGRVLAIAARDGARLWEFAAGDSVLAAPAVAGKRLFFGSYDRHVYALDAGSGRLLWKHDARGPVVSTPAVDRGRAIVGSRSYDLLALDAGSGAVAWGRYVWFSWIESSARVREGVIYVGSSDAAALFAFDARAGTPLWKTDAFGWAWGQPAVTRERVYIGAVGTGGYLAPHRGAALAVDRDHGRPVWRFAATPAADGKAYGFAGSPAVGDGLVFFTGLDGRVYAFAA